MPSEPPDRPNARRAECYMTAFKHSVRRSHGFWMETESFSPAVLQSFLELFSGAVK